MAPKEPEQTANYNGECSMNCVDEWRNGKV